MYFEGRPGTVVPSGTVVNPPLAVAWHHCRWLPVDLMSSKLSPFSESLITFPGRLFEAVERLSEAFDFSCFVDAADSERLLS